MGQDDSHNQHDHGQDQGSYRNLFAFHSITPFPSDFVAHEAARTDQQHDDQEHEGNDVLVDRGDEQDGEGLDHADEKTAEDRAGDVAEAADDTGRPALQADHVGHGQADGEQRDGQDADDAADDAAQAGRNIDAAVDVDAHDGSSRLVLRNAAHGLAGLCELQEHLKRNDQKDGHNDDISIRLGKDEIADFDYAGQEAGNREGVRKAVHTTLAIAVAAGAILTVAGVVTTPMILRAMDTPQEVFEQSSQYLQVYFGGIFFSVIYNMSAGILNAVGNSRRSLIYLIIAAVSNIFLDIFFVVILKMGIIGAALATDISQLLSCIFILGFLMRSQESYHVRLRDIRFYDNLLGKILKIGLPTGFQNIVISISNVIVQSSVNSFGAVVMAGYAAYVKVDGFNILPVLSFSMAASTFAGQNVGAGKYDRVKKGMWVSTGMGVGYTIIFRNIIV